MTREDEQTRAMVSAYDAEAEATGWLGPQVVFGLAYRYIQPGQTILDIGIGTGLGSVLFHKAGLEVHGMDQSPEMLAGVRGKGFAVALQQHDLTQPPYPYPPASLDHAICTGVFNFFQDLSPVFQEVARILRTGGLFVFVVGDRRQGDVAEFVVGSEYTGTGAPVTLYRHSPGQIEELAKENGFASLGRLEFMAYMDHEKQKKIPSRAYMIRKR